MCLFTFIVPSFHVPDWEISDGEGSGIQHKDRRDGNGRRGGFAASRASQLSAVYSGHPALKIEPLFRADSPYPILTLHFMDPSTRRRFFIHVYSFFRPRRTSILTFTMPVPFRRRTPVGSVVPNESVTEAPGNRSERIVPGVRGTT
uniref:Uncharacterized protein n=1 Tax=Toxoplasma gondii (strain ATCC 50861 / VEG) TaxID=432359 RepID=A0A0F7V7F9_TOXGV|nr:TPA: hypothetical protein BN1205_064280 [Toxoplasma gondii VEG]